MGMHLEGIIRLLGDHLYTNPGVVVRELIQNAYDSCRRYEIEGYDQEYVPRIDIEIDQLSQAFIVRDNGAGLTENEIHSYLATIGRGYTSGLRNRDSDASDTLIGQFGLGFLSSFIVANHVELQTRSRGSGSVPWKWESVGGSAYKVFPGTNLTYGTAVKLSLKSQGEFLLNTGLVEQIIRTYADLLPIPIYVNGSADPVNAGNAPWDRDDVEKSDYVDFLHKRLGISQPLTVVPVTSQIVSGKLKLPLQGVLFVPSARSLSIYEFGDVAVYVRRMLVVEQEHDLLPRWARFVRGVVECPLLEPTASREELRKDATFFQVQLVLGDQLLAHFNKLSRERPEVWNTIILEHNDLIKGWSLESQKFFEAICDLVTFDTSRGRMKLPDYLAETAGTIYYFTEKQGAVQEKILFESQGIPVLDATGIHDRKFLQEYALLHDTIELKQLEPGAISLFTLTQDGLERWESIKQYFVEQGIPVELVSFQPTTIPALLIHEPDSDHLTQAHSMLADQSLGEPLAKLVESYLAMRDPHNTADTGVLHINTSNSLMSYLASIDTSSSAFTAALEIVLHNARFFAGKSLTAQKAAEAFDLVSFSLEQIVRTIAQDNAGSDPSVF